MRQPSIGNGARVPVHQSWTQLIAKSGPSFTECCCCDALTDVLQVSISEDRSGMLFSISIALVLRSTCGTAGSLESSHAWMSFAHSCRNFLHSPHHAPSTIATRSGNSEGPLLLCQFLNSTSLTCYWTGSWPASALGAAFVSHTVAARAI